MKTSREKRAERVLPQVDPNRVRIYGGSYSGFLSALALARDSKLFAAGVDTLTANR